MGNEGGGREVGGARGDGGWKMEDVIDWRMNQSTIVKNICVVINL